MDAALDREETVRWQQPPAMYASDAELTGLEYLAGMIDGRTVMPPVAQAIGISVKEVSRGHVTFLLDAPEFLTNHLGFVAGGILATALDSALGCAALSTLDAALDIVTLDLTVDFVRPTHYGAGILAIDADAVYVGRNRSLSIGRITDPDGKLIASGKSNCLIRPKQA